MFELRIRAAAACSDRLKWDGCENWEFYANWMWPKQWCCCCLVLHARMHVVVAAAFDPIAARVSVCVQITLSLCLHYDRIESSHTSARAPHLNDRRADFFFVFLREINSHVLLRLRVESHSGARRYLWPQISYRLLATIAFEWTHLFWICVFWCFQFASQLVLGPNPLNEFVRNGVSPDKNLILSIWIAKRLSNCWQTCLAGCCRHSANSTRYSATCRTHTHKATQKYNQPWFWLFGVNNIPVENTASVLFLSIAFSFGIRFASKCTHTTERRAEMRRATVECTRFDCEWVGIAIETTRWCGDRRWWCKRTQFNDHVTAVWALAHQF